MSFNIDVFKQALEVATPEDADDLAEILALISTKLEELVDNGTEA